MSDRTVLSFLVKEGGSIQSYETSSSELFQTDNHIPASTVKTADNGPLTPPPAPTRGSRDQPTCFRISGVPSSWTMANLEHAIKTIDSEFSIDEVELSLFPACCDSTQTALLNLNYSTAYFQGFERNDERLEIIRENGRKIRLSIDKHFYDWTPMNTPQAPIVADVIAVTGLGGHAFGSWRNRKTRAMWLQEFLPEHLNNARIMTYGYDCSLEDPNEANLTDYRRGFIEQLENARQNCLKRPVIFIGHSLGGILILQTLVEYPGIRDYVKGIFFFGTPHQGLETVDLEQMVDMETHAIDNHKIRNLLAQLKEGSEFLENQKDVLSRTWDKFSGKIFSFYETEKTKSVKKLDSGLFKRVGNEVQMVKRFSAQLFLPDERRIPIISNHTDMVKFDTPRNATFMTVVRNMKACVASQLEADGALAKSDKVELQSLVDSVNPGDFLPILIHVDQKRYCETLSKATRPSDNGKFQWLFQNMDYKEWKTSSRVMVLSGPPKCDLEQAASHVVHTLQEEKGAGLQPLLLHFFYRSAKYVPCPYIEPLRICWQDMVCKYTLLWQAIYDCPRPRQSLLKACLSAILANLDDNLIPGVLALTPTESLRRLLNAVTLEGFLVALLQALTTNGHLDAPNIGSGRPEQNTISQTSKTKRSLTFIFDLDYLPSETWKVLIDSIRQTMQTRQDVLTVKLLVTSPPIVATLGLQRLLDILLVYDEERQGLALPHFVNMILMATLTLTFVTLDCLKTLHFDNMQYEKISTQHENTFGWLWNNQRYQKWETSKRSNRLFIEGKPGSGKSTLVRYFRDQLPSRLSYGDSAIIAAFFYSQKDGNLGRSHCHMLRSLLYDILLADELFFIHFQQEYRRLKHPGSGSTTWRYEILKDILMKCAAHPLKTKLFLIIDALDESEIDNRRDVLLLLRNLSGMTNKKCMVKVFLASQPITELPKDFKLTCQHILLQERNRKDIEHYTQAFFDDQDFNVDQAIKTEAKNYIVAEAAGVFLWVRLIRDAMVGYINKGLNKSQILKFLKSLPKELESYYEHMLKGLNRGDQVDIRDGKRILQFCLFSDRVLELAELRHALAIPGDIGESFDPEPRARFFEDQMSINIRKRVTHCADNFVEIKNDHNQNFEATAGAIVQVMHQTVREFFLRPHNAVVRSDFCIPKDEACRMIGITCIRYLLLHHEELKVKAPKPTGDWSLEQCRVFASYLNDRPFIKYSLEYVMRHKTDNDPGFSQLLSGLLVTIHDCPPSPAFCLLKRLDDSNIELDTVKTQRNRLLWVAAEGGYGVAVGNLLAATAASDYLDEKRRTPLHIAAMSGHEMVARLLVGGGANIEPRDILNRTPLHLAALKGHEAVALLLIDRGANTDSRSDGTNNFTPLHIATSAGHEAVAQILIEKSANIESRSGINNSTPLHLAARAGHEAVARVLISKGASIESLDGTNQKALHLAAREGHEGMARVLVDGGAKIECGGCIGCTPLHIAAARGHQAVVRLLIEKGANIESRDADRWTPLHLAAGRGHEVVAELLIDKGANIEPRDVVSRTPLHIAVWAGYEPIARLLIDKGGKIEYTDPGGWTALDIAAWIGHEAVTQLLMEKGAKTEPRQFVSRMPLHFAVWRGLETIVRLLIENGANIESRDPGGWTPLHFAAGRGHLAIAQLLIDRGAGLKPHDIVSRTPLDIAAWTGHQTIVRLLIDKGAYAEPRHAASRTPLHFAAWIGHEVIARLLINKGASLESRDPDGWTPLHYAAAGRGHVSIAWLLIKAGASIEPRDVLSRTPLHIAGWNQCTAMAQTLIDNGADARATDNQGLTPTHLANLAVTNGHRGDPIAGVVLPRLHPPHLVPST